jgi:hypothetical protein
MPYSPVSAATVLVASVALIAPGAAQAKSPPKRAPSAAPVRAKQAPARAPAPHRPPRASSAGRRIR